MESQGIRLNDILGIEDLSNVKVRFNLMFDGHWNPTDFYKNRDHETLLNGQYWNYSKMKSYKAGQVNLGFIRVEDDLWLLFHVGRVIKDLNVFNGVGYEYTSLPDFDKYCGRLIVRYKNKYQNMVRLASSVLDDCFVKQILPSEFDNDLFPGYENVDLCRSDLSRLVDKPQWKAALSNQKGVYLITDVSNGKMYVGSAYGTDMILGRWKSYVKNYHGGNVELKELDCNNIKDNFRYSILDIFKATTNDETVLSREAWWKNILRTREFGYNAN